MTSASYLIPQARPPMDAQITLPGSKSIALRQLAMAALCHGQTELTGIPNCDDTDAMLACIAALGADVAQLDDKAIITGPINFTTDVRLDARMSGASMRLLLGIAALRTGKTLIDGHSSLQARTNAPLLDVFAAHGCQVTANNGCLPTTIQGPFTPPTKFAIDGSLSSQYVSALLLGAPLYASNEEQIITISGELVSKPYIDITLNEMAKRGISARWTSDNELVVRRGNIQPATVTVEGDATAATYFAALATLHGGSIELTNLGASTVQGDYGFMQIMEELGASVDRQDASTNIQGPNQLQPLPPTDMNTMPDAALTLIALAPLLPKISTITGLSSLHHKECDRLECPATEFRGMGIKAVTEFDSIQIEPIAVEDIRHHTMKTYHDHRMAMAFSMLGSVSGNLTVDEKTVVNKTYPSYWHDYDLAAVGSGVT